MFKKDFGVLHSQRQKGFNVFIYSELIGGLPVVSNLNSKKRTAIYCAKYWRGNQRDQKKIAKCL